MISRGLNSNNDIFLENGSFTMVKDGAEVVQNVRSRLLFYLGEWDLDTSAGTAWFQEVFKKPVNLARVESVIKTRIIQTNGVLRLLTFETNFNSDIRRLTVDFSAETTYGVIIKDEVTVNA